MTRNYDDEIVLDLRRIALALRRYILPALLAMVLLGGMGFAYGTARRYTRYTARVDFFLYADREGKVLYGGTEEEAKAAVQAGTTAFETRARTYADILTGPAMARAILDRLDLDMEAEDLADMLDMEIPDDFQVMRILVEGRDRDMVLAAADALADLAPGMIRTRVGAGAVRAAEEAVLTSETVGGRKRFLFAGMAAGLLLVLGAGCWKELLYKGFRTEEEIDEALGLPVLGALPAGEEGRQEGLRYLRLSVQRLFRESRKPLRRKRGRILALVSPDAESGAAGLAASLAESLRQAGIRTALVTGTEEDPEAGTYALPEQDKEAAFYSGLKDAYELILAAPEPLLEAPWGAGILDQAEKALLVIAYDGTGRRQARQALDLARTGTSGIQGLVLTGLSPDKAGGDSLERFLMGASGEKSGISGLFRAGRGKKDGE